MKTSKDKKCVFYEDTHTYFLGEKRLTSVTQYLSKYKPYFDSELISEKYAKKHGLKQEDVLEMWSKKGIEACEMGSFVHKIFEDYINGEMISLRADYPKCNVAEKFINDYFKSGKLTPIETEFIVYNDELAGQIDCIAKNPFGEYFILDWKTNSEIKYDNRFQSMLDKYSYLDDCSYNHYSIQLEMYKSMCKEYPIKDCFIVHLEDEDYKIIKTKHLLVR